MEVCYWALLFMPLVILHHLLNVFVQLANKRGFKQKKYEVNLIREAIILPVGLYGRETWSLIVREEHRLRVFGNRVLRKIFEPKRDEVTGGWGKLHNEELLNLYSSPSVIRTIKPRRIRWAGHVARMVRGGGMHLGY
jgi:hypothetical protein